MSQLYSIEVFGFNATERIVLSSIFNLSARRSPSFSPYAGTPGTHPNLFLVDASDAQFIAQLQSANPDRAIPSILIGDDDHRTGWPLLARPLQWARLFRAFDEAVSSREEQRLTPPSWHNTDDVESLASLASLDAAITQIGMPASNARPGGPYRGEWVLVVDDSATIRRFMLNTLTALGLNVDVADSGEQAIGLTATKPYVCVFLDVMLPGVDGYQVCRLIKSKRALQRATVIMLTSKNSPFDRLRGSMAGCDSYLVKPVDQATLLKAMENAMSEWERASQRVSRVLSSSGPAGRSPSGLRITSSEQ